MSLPDLTRADYVAPPPPPAVGMTDLNALLGVPAAGVEENAVPADTREAFARALRYGAINAAIGCALFALVGHWVMLGLVSIVVGILVGTKHDALVGESSGWQEVSTCRLRGGDDGLCEVVCVYAGFVLKRLGQRGHGAGGVSLLAASDSRRTLRFACAVYAEVSAGEFVALGCWGWRSCFLALLAAWKFALGFTGGGGDGCMKMEALCGRR